MIIKEGDEFEACDPRERPPLRDPALRIRVMANPGAGDAVEIATVAENGTATRRRRIQRKQLHDSAATRNGQDRITGYARVKEATPEGTA